MINLKIPYVEKLLNIEVEKHNLIILENLDYFVHVVNEIKNFLAKKDAQICFLKGHELCEKVDNMFLITDIFNIDFNSKVIQNMLCKKILQEFLNQEYSLNSLYCDAVKIMLKSISDFNFSIDYNEFLDKNLFYKLFSVKINDEYSSILEKLVAFVDIMVDLCDLKYLIFVNLFEYISKEKYLLFFEHCVGKGIAILHISSNKKHDFPNENIVIIDNDLCEVLVNI